MKPARSAHLKFSVNLSHDVGLRLREIAFHERFSESSIVEIALDRLFANTTDARLAALLRRRGASLRRTAPARES